MSDALPPSRRRWTRTRETQPDGRVVEVSSFGPYRAWRDDDIVHGSHACSVTLNGFELILGHASSLTKAKELADASEAGMHETAVAS